MSSKAYRDFVMESTFIHNVNTGVVLDNSVGAKRQAQGMAYNTGQLHNDRPNPYAENTKMQSNYLRPNHGMGDK